MNQPDSISYRVAVITRTKDRPVLLRRAMESVLSQSFQDWVHVIINDGGRPEAVNLLAAEFETPYQGRLMVLHNPSPTGMQNASNAAIQAVASEFAAIHDDDDSWEPAFLECCVAHLDRLGASHPVQGVVTNTIWIFEEINAHGQVVELWRKDYPALEAIKLLDVAGENRFPPIAFLYRRNAHETVGWFNEEFSVMGDWDFNLRFLCRHDIDVIPEKLARWHWRHQAGGTVYGNTVTAGVAIHKAMEARMFNHYMRRDMDSGRAGLGHLINISRPIALLSRQVDDLTQRIEHEQGTASATLAHTEHLNRITRDWSRLWAAKEWVRRGLCIVRERRAVPTVAEQQPRDARAEIARAIDGLESDCVLSLDVFDTALLRVLRQPIDLFAFIEPQAGILAGQPELPFAQARVTAERVARHRHVNEDCEDVTLRQTYDLLGELSGIDDDACARIMDLEIATERRLCYANPILLDAARKAKDKGIRVIFVSDMYLPEEIIRDLLESNGYDAPEVFVSCAGGKTKHSGALFKDVLDKLGCAPDRIFHIGDHADSDHNRPSGMGIRTLHIDRADWGQAPFADQHAALSGAGGAEVLSSVFTGLTRRRSVIAGGAADDVWDRLGYELAGPMIYAFVRWIAQQAHAQDVRRLFFLSRDGYLLERAFRSCAAKWGLEIESTYMFSSRRLLNLARIEQLDTNALDFLLTADPFLRVRDFLSRIGLKPDSYGSKAVAAGFKNLDQELTTRHGFFLTPALRETMQRLLSWLSPEILAIAAAERQRTLAYFDGIGFGSAQTAIVDLGWQASSIRSLQDLIRRRQPDHRLRGYYFGTWHSATPALEAGCRLDSFLFHLGQPEHRAGLLSECVELVEHMFAAPHPTVVSIEQSATGWNPIYGGWETTPGQRQCLDKVTRAAMQFVDDMLPYEPELSAHVAPFGYLESVLERVLRHPTRSEAQLLGALPHRASFGGDAPWRHLAKAPPVIQSVFKPASVQEAYERAYWRAGLLAQLTPAQKAMVTE